METTFWQFNNLPWENNIFGSMNYLFESVGDCDVPWSYETPDSEHMCLCLVIGQIRKTTSQSTSGLVQTLGNLKCLKQWCIICSLVEFSQICSISCVEKSPYLFFASLNLLLEDKSFRTFHHRCIFCGVNMFHVLAG